MPRKKQEVVDIASLMGGDTFTAGGIVLPSAPRTKNEDEGGWGDRVEDSGFGGRRAEREEEEPSRADADTQWRRGATTRPAGGDSGGGMRSDRGRGGDRYDDRRDDNRGGGGGGGDREDTNRSDGDGDWRSGAPKKPTGGRGFDDNTSSSSRGLNGFESSRQGAGSTRASDSGGSWRREASPRDPPAASTSSGGRPRLNLKPRTKPMPEDYVPLTAPEKRPETSSTAEGNAESGGLSDKWKNVFKNKENAETSSSGRWGKSNKESRFDDDRFGRDRFDREKYNRREDGPRRFGAGSTQTDTESATSKPVSSRWSRDKPVEKPVDAPVRPVMSSRFSNDPTISRTPIGEASEPVKKADKPSLAELKAKAKATQAALRADDRFDASGTPFKSSFTSSISEVVDVANISEVVKANSSIEKKVKPSLAELKALAKQKNRVNAGGRSDDDIKIILDAAASKTPEEVMKVALTGDAKLSEGQMKKLKSLCEEYLEVRDMKEALLCVEELKLNKPMREYAELVRRCIHVVLESTKESSWPVVANLFNELKKQTGLSTADVELGFQRVRNELHDISIDSPTAPKIFKVLEHTAIGLGVIDNATVTPSIDFEWWKAPAVVIKYTDDQTIPEIGYAAALQLLQSGKVGEELLSFAKEAEALPAPVEMMAALIFYLLEISKNEPLSLIKPNEGGEEQILELGPETFGVLLERIFYHTKLDKQIRALFEAQGIIASIGFPKIEKKSFLESLFVTLYDLELMPDDAFMGWRGANNGMEGKGKAILQCNAWLNWLETAAAEEDDSEDDE